MKEGADADLELPWKALWPASWHAARAARETVRMASASAGNRSAQRRAGVSVVDITSLFVVRPCVVRPCVPLLSAVLLLTAGAGLWLG